MLVPGAFDQIDRAQVIANLLFEGPGTFAVQNPDFEKPSMIAFVDKILRSLQRFGHPHTAHVDLLGKLQPAFGRTVIRDRNGRGTFVAHRLFIFGIRDGFQPLGVESRQNLP